ncbi:hypothetical protein [Acidiphilium sp. JA12-A1]|uniref:hypothetical protein n=1 Tax=Acidiphilium sp. JA12-A1 TaxID=1464546 RepID=UPI001364AD18|nr:hypothetical protein [Acidiphilium sp. JA12-A1]
MPVRWNATSDLDRFGWWSVVTAPIPPDQTICGEWPACGTVVLGRPNSPRI